MSLERIRAQVEEHGGQLAALLAKYEELRDGMDGVAKALSELADAIEKGATSAVDDLGERVAESAAKDRDAAALEGGMGTDE